MSGAYLVKCKCGTIRCETWNEWVNAASNCSVVVGYRKAVDPWDREQTYNVNADFRCSGCGRYFQVTQIRGRVSEHVCGAKCLASKGPSCECSCGGKNHGRNYA